MGLMEWMVGACVILLWSVMVLLRDCLTELKQISENQIQQQNKEVERHQYISGSLSELQGYIYEVRHVANEFYVEYIGPRRQ